MKKWYLLVCTLALCGTVLAQHDLNILASVDYGIPLNTYDQRRDILHGTAPTRQFNMNTGLQYRAFNHLGFEVGIGQSIRTLRAVDDRLAQDSPEFRSVMRSKNHYITAFGGLQCYLPMSDDDYFVFSGGYAWNYIGGGSVSATDHFVAGSQTLSVNSQYAKSTHSFYGEFGYHGSPAGRSTLYIGLKVNIGTSPIMTSSYAVATNDGSASYTDAVTDKGTYIGMNLKYYLNVLHKDKVERQPKPEKKPRERKHKVDTAPMEVKHILKDTMIVDGRPVLVGQSMVAKSAEVTISVWDAEAIDGDSIALILNGEYLLQNQSLTGEKILVKAKLKPGKNYLVMYAHNQGKYPPNTAAIIVDDGIRKNQIELKSNLKTSGALEITLGN